jgi:PAP2 superfamily protein
MQNLQLGWQPAAALSVGLFAGAVGIRLPRADRSGLAERAAPFLREAGVVAALYTLWQLASSVTVLDGAGAYRRARWIVRVQRAGRLPSEHGVQRLITGHPLLAQSANWYYAAVHFTALGGLLLWLFARHRARYREVRTVLVLLTGSSLLLQLVPVAPPRLLPELGYVDTAALYDQSVYALSGISVHQLAAMPSVHVGWALLVAWAVIRVSPSRYRWWVLVHPVLTVFVVVATANHFWLDGIVAAVLLALSIALLRLARWSTGTGADDGDAGRSTVGHRRQRRAHLVQADHAGDQLVGSYHTGPD